MFDHIDDKKTRLEWARYEHIFKRQEVKAKTILLKEGEVSTKAFYIEKGCVRMWFNNNGKDITFQFFFEGQGVSSIESFMTKQPSLFTIETIEPCTIQTVSRKDFQMVIDNSAIIKAQIEASVFERLILYQKLFLSRIKDNPKKRYDDLLKNRPEILKRIPQHLIASYLGITSVSLSRIRNRR